MDVPYRTYDNKINRLHETCLRLIYNDKCSSFEELLVKDKSVSAHHKNIHTLVTETFKVYIKTSSEIMQEVFQTNDQEHYFLRNQRDFIIPTIKFVNYDLKSIRFLGQKYGKAFPIISTTKGHLEVLKWPLRNGNQNHVLVVSVKHTCRT